MALIYLFPEADVSAGENVFGSTSPLCLGVDDPLGQVDEADYIGSFARNQDTSGQVVFDLTPAPAVVSINSVLVRAWANHDGFSGPGQLTLGVHVGGAAYNGPLAAPRANFKWYEAFFAKNPTTDAAWAPTDLSALRVVTEGWDGSGTTSAIIWAAIYVEVDAVIVPRAVGAVRDRASRGMRFQGRYTARVTAPLELGAWPLLSPLALSHFALPPAGASPRRRDRRLCLLTGRSLDLDTLRLTLTATELRRVTVAEVDTGYSPEDEISPAASGVMRLARGGRSFERASKKWVPSPIDRRIVQVFEDSEPLSADGYLIEDRRTNAISASSLVNGTAGLSFGGVGTGDSAITLDTSVLWFDPVVTPHTHRFNAGTPHTADLYEQFAATASFAAGGSVCVSVAHLDATAAAPLYFALQRSVDSKWWPGSNGPAWSSSRAWWPLSAAVGEFLFHLAARVDVGGAATTYTLLVGIPATGGVAGQVNWRAHAHIESGHYPSATPIVTNGAAYTREADQLYCTNDHGRRTWPVLHGSGQLRFRPLGWTDSMLAAGEEVDAGAERVLVDATFDASNGHVLLYRQGVGFVLRRRLAGVNYEAIADVLIDTVREYSVGWRWTGPEGELGLAPYTLSVIVDGVRGTDVVAPGYHRPAPSSAVVRIGHAAGPVKVADIALLYRELTPVVLDDDELVDF